MSARMRIPSAGRAGTRPAQEKLGTDRAHVACDINTLQRQGDLAYG
jgi:hypothetical protein